MKELTRQELFEQERGPKTKQQSIMDGVIVLLPYAAAMLMFIIYYKVPNKSTNRNPHTFTILVCFWLAIYGILLIRSLFSKERFAKIRYNAPIYTAVIVLICWYDWLTLKTGTLPLPFFPWVNEILNAIVDDRSMLLVSTLCSLKLLFTGYFIGTILGLMTGIASGYNKRIHYWINPVIKLLGPIPSTTWIPIILVLVSSLFKGSVFIIALGVWFAVTIASMTGIQNVDIAYLEVARTLGAKNWQLILHVAIPSALPNILQGMTQGMSSACTALLIAEMMGAKAGLGWYITWQKSWALYAKMYAAIVLICLIFILVTFLLNTAKRYLLRWQEGMVK